MAQKFRVGDRVRILENRTYEDLGGLGGTVRGYNMSHDSWAVELDLPYSAGHFCDGLVPSCSGWFLGNDMLVKLEGPAKIPQNGTSMFPTDAAERKKIPIGTGVLDYFSQALIEVAKVSFVGNEQHNPGEPLHWARGKSMDQADTMLRHFMERGQTDSDGVRHSAKMVWRALAILQLELEAEGYSVARGAK